MIRPKLNLKTFQECHRNECTRHVNAKNVPLWIVEMPKYHGKKESTKRVSNTRRRSHACQLEAARENRQKASVAAQVTILWQHHRVEAAGCWSSVSWCRLDHFIPKVVNTRRPTPYPLWHRAVFLPAGHHRGSLTWGEWRERKHNPPLPRNNRESGRRKSQQPGRCKTEELLWSSDRGGIENRNGIYGWLHFAKDRQDIKQRRRRCCLSSAQKVFALSHMA